MSVRAELVRTGLRWLIKHRNHRELTVEQHRRFVTVAERLVPDPPAKTRTLPVDADGVRADMITTPASEADRHVLFLHGGAFIIGSPNLYRHLTWRIARRRKRTCWRSITASLPNTLFRQRSKTRSPRITGSSLAARIPVGLR